MHLLLADAQKETRSLPATMLSVALHAGIVVLIVLSGQQVVRGVNALIEQAVQYLYPVDRDLGALRPGQASMGAGTGLRAQGPLTPLLKGGTAGSDRFVSTPQGGTTFPLPIEGTSIEPGVGDNAFSLVDVDSLAERDPSSAAPEYPPALIERHVEGGALFRFVVDSTGLIDMSTVHVVSSTHPLFTKAVLDAMPKMHFKPARIGDHPVRLLVQLPFTFKLQRPKKSIS